MYGTYACSSQGLSQEGRLKQQIQFQTTFLSTSHHSNQTKATHRHTHVGSTAGKTIIRSGGDTTLKGAQIIGKGVQADTRNLHIESVQDTEIYQSKQQNGNVQVTVGYGFSASGSYSQSKVKADHASVTEQSGIYAGEDGYQIKVRDNTDLKGGIITSGKSAEDKGKNLFQTATLTASDIQNHSHYEGKSFGIGASVAISGESMGQNRPADSGPGIRLTDASKGQNNNNAIGYGSDGDSKNSTTRSGINTRNIHITDKAGQLARTGRTAKETEARIYTGIDTETADQHSGRLKNSFDKDAVAKEINLQREVTQEFGKNAAQTTAAVSDKLGNTRSYERYQAAKTLLEAKLQNTDSETEKAAIRASLGQVNAYLAENQSRYDTWKEGGIGRSILHGAAGGLTTGNLGGILAGGGTSLAAPYLDKAAENLGPAGKAAVNALGGAAIGYAAGGNAGTAAVGANVDWNNRRLHDSEIRKIKDNAAKFAKLHPGISQRQAEKRLVAQAMRQVDAAYYAKHADTDTAAEQFLRSIAGSFKADGETFLDFAPMKYYRDSGKFAEQQGYRETREQLKRNAVSSYTERSRQIRNKTFDTATAGLGKGVANLPSFYANGFIGTYNGVIGKLIGKEAPYVPVIMEYNNPVEKEVGDWAADKVDRALGMITGIRIGAVSPGRSVWNKNGKTGAGQKTGRMSVLDGEMAGGNKNPITSKRHSDVTKDYAGVTEQKALPKPDKSAPKIRPNGTVELFTDSKGVQIPGAVGVSPSDPMAVARDARFMPNIPTGSQARVIANNPYIPKPEGKFTIMDYLPEAARITKKGGEIVINGTPNNKYLRGIPNETELARMGLRLKYNGPLKEEFKQLKFHQSDGKDLRSTNYKTIVFEKVK